jgi:hypothetical protein
MRPFPRTPKPAGSAESSNTNYFPSDGAIHALSMSMRDPNPQSPERDNPDIPLGMTFSRSLSITT